MKKVLVTGAAGFIGINLVKELVKKEYEVYGLVRKNNLESIMKLNAISQDIVIVDNIDLLIGCAESYGSFEYIFHLATVGVMPNDQDIEMMCEVNIKMGVKVIDFARKNNSNLVINFGSCFEYGDHGNDFLKEEMTCYPESLYAISKNASTKMMTEYAKKQKVSLITVRPFGVFGIGESYTRLAPSIIRKCINGETVQTTEGNQVRDFVNVSDVAKATIQLVEGNYKEYEIYNLCSGNPVKVREFIKEIVEVCGFEESLIEFGALPYRENEAMVFAGDNSKIQEVINYPFPNNHREGIKELYECIKREVE